jgi:hypothetical protein
MGTRLPKAPVRLLLSIFGAFALIIGVQGQAQADSASAVVGERDAGVLSQSIYLDVYWNDVFRGYSDFNADPSGSIPGDSIRACDGKADGRGIVTQLDINRNGTVDRSASTRGKNAPYCTSWKGGNIAENKPVRIRGCVVRGDWSACTGWYNGSA